ncbi:MAG TPA: NAD(P)/FAD-dependent oxidoreductase [Polyangia bacterium]|jgi:phytoene dehydrogenase-like protein
MTHPRSVSIVGAGVAGLAAGVLLARRGVQVQVFEAAGKPGGCCANTSLGGFTFHDGAVFLGLPGVLDAVFAELDLDRARLLPLRRIDPSYCVHLPDDSTVAIGAGAIRVGERQVSEPEVAAFLARWRPVLRLLTGELLLRPFSVWRALTRGGLQLLKLRGTAGAELRRSFTDEAVRSALAGTLLFAGAAADHLPASAVVALAALLDEGFFLPVGGMGRIPEVLAQALVAAGGELHLGRRVQRIVVEGRRVRGLEVEALGRVDSDTVLSTVSGMATFLRLLAPEVTPSPMRRKAEAAPLSHQAVSVQLGLTNRIESTAHSSAVVPMMAEQQRVFSSERDTPWLNWAVPTMTVPELAPPGGSVVEIFCPLPPRSGSDARRDAELADRAVELLARRHRLDVSVRRVRGPQQFEEEMNLFAGALYGLSPAASPRCQFPHRTPVPGLFLAGQTTYPGYGAHLAARSGVIAARSLLGELR